MTSNGTPLFLIGAGASVEADVPTAIRMTQKLTEHLANETGRADRDLLALNYLVGSIAVHGCS